MEDARRIAEHVARASYGRLIAYLSSRSRDVAAAEDALAEAFRAALQTWPERGAPDNPEAWLLTAARRNLMHAARHAKVRAAAEPDLIYAAQAAQALAEAEPDLFPDERLKLLFVCAHPAVDPAARAPLMLQTVLGLDAARIASAFLTAPSAMSQRLVRAKARIKAAGLTFAEPPAEALAERLDAVLEAVYAAYGSGWEDVDGADPRRRGLAGEAIWLARLICALCPQEPEARGLLALMLHCEARKGARRGPDGAFIPLSEQDARLWDPDLAAEAEGHLEAARDMGRLGHFQLEAAIQSAHAARAVHGRTPWRAIALLIALLYEGLVRLDPTLGVLVGRAAAYAEAQGPEHGPRQGLDLLAAALRDHPAALSAYQPYWALRAHLCARSGETAAAREAYDRAAGLTEDAAVRAFLLDRRAALT